MSYLSREALEQCGFAHVGENVRVSPNASFHGIERISIGDHSRIDDFCVFSAGEGGISIGRYVHVGVFSSIIGAGHVEVGDFTDISSRVSIYSSNEDYSGATITPPTVPIEIDGIVFRGVTHGPVTIGRHCIVACGSVILPDVTIEDGVAIGALTLVKETCAAYGVYVGVPARHIRQREREFLKLEKQLIEAVGAGR